MQNVQMTIRQFKSDKKQLSFSAEKGMVCENVQ